MYHLIILLIIKDKNDMQFNLRWDKGDLIQYYNTTRDLLSVIPSELFKLKCNKSCNDITHKELINLHYHYIVQALKTAEAQFIPKIPSSALKPFWNDSLDEIKQKSIFWHSIWCSMGKSKTGLVQQIKTSTHFQYKRAVKSAFNEYDNRYNDELLNHLLNKDNVNFWKSWNSKMHSNVTKDVDIDGSNNPISVENSFANYSKTYTMILNVFVKL